MIGNTYKYNGPPSGFSSLYYSSHDVFLKYTAHLDGKKAFLLFRTFFMSLLSIRMSELRSYRDSSINFFPRDLNVGFFDDHIMVL